MFEKEIEFIYNYNLNKIKHLGSFITYEQLVSTDIHPALLQYVSAEIDFLIYEDRQKLLKNSLFDYSGDKISEHFAYIGEEIKQSKKFSLEYLTKLLLHASSFNINYIVRPKWSLLQFIFENENETEKQVIEVKQILNYLYYYPYLKRLLISFFNKKRLITISQSELEELLNKIDKINYESNFDKVLDDTLKNMVEFINMGEPRNTKVSKQSVELFLNDKSLSQYNVVLTENFGVNGNEKFDINEFKNVILNYNADNYNSIDEPDTFYNSANETEDEEVTYTSENEEIVDDNVTEDESINNDFIEDNNVEDETTQEEDTNDNIYDKEKISEVTEEAEKKSFLESHIDNLDEEITAKNESEKTENDELPDSQMEELEPPDIDEAPRVDEENIEEAYEFAIEEESLDEIVEDDKTDLERVAIDENEEDPFESESDIDESSEEENNIKIEMEEDNLESLVKEGTSITFSSDELEKQDESIEETQSQTTDDEDDDWTVASSSESEINIVDEKIENNDDNYETDTNNEEIASEIEPQLEENETIQEADESIIEETSDKNSETTEITDEEIQPALFNDDDFEEEETTEQEKIISDSEKIEIEEETTNYNEMEETNSPVIDISVLLENKKITKIIEVIFDYDMEEFANAIDKISECRSETEALATVDEIARSSYISESSKEIKLFKNIISDFFK